MLRKIVFLTFILFVSSNILGQDKVQLDKFEVNNILRTLFEVKSFNKDGKGKWKPNVYEWYKMPKSDDGYCYTGIDTILYSTVNNEEKAVVIFETIPYNNGERVECHGCNVLLSLATFTRNNNLWELTEFEKIFQRKVDLLTNSSIRNPILRNSIDASKILIYDGKEQKVSF